MKRKIMMMGLAMLAGVPNSALAKSAREDTVQTYSSWNAAYTPHYGIEGSASPLMDHVSVAAALPGPSASNAWRLKFAPPVAVYRADDPMAAKDKRVGLSLKLDF